MLDTASAYRAYPPKSGCRLLSPRSRLAAAIVFAAFFAIATGAVFTIFAIFATGAVFTSLAAGSRPYFSIFAAGASPPVPGPTSVGRPAVKRLGCCGESNIHFLTRSEVNWRCRSELDSIRQVNLNPNLLQGTAQWCFRHRAVKGVALPGVGRPPVKRLGCCGESNIHI